MTDKHQSRQSASPPLVRGEFSDGHTLFTVRVSNSSAPDSFQVSANNNPADIVLIVSGINTGHLHATWGDGWRTFASDWKAWVEDSAFAVFYSGRTIGHSRNIGPHEGSTGGVRFCNG